MSDDEINEDGFHNAAGTDCRRSVMTDDEEDDRSLSDMLEGDVFYTPICTTRTGCSP